MLIAGLLVGPSLAARRGPYRLEPPRLFLTPGETTTVQVLFLETGEPVPLDRVRFEVIPPHLGRVEGGRFVAEKAGEGILRAVVRGREGEFAVHSFVRIRPQAPPLKVRVIPHRVHLRPGERVRFQARVLYRGQEVLAAVRWRVLPEWAGRIEADGTFRAGDLAVPAKILAKAEWEGRQALGFATVIIGNPREHQSIQLELSPELARIGPQGEVQFTYRVLQGPSRGLEENWWVEPPELGRIEKGRFTPRLPRGRGVVWLLVRAGDQIGIARALVMVGEERPGPREGLPPHPHLRPEILILRPGESGEIEAVLRRPAPRRWTWRVVPPELARVIPERPPVRARVVARRPGIGRVVAMPGRGPRLRALLIVGRYRAEITPSEVFLTPGDTLRFQARIFDEAGNPVEVLHTWRVFPEEVGTIRADGLFTARAPGRAVVVLQIPPESGGGGGAARVRVAP